MEFRSEQNVLVTLCLVVNGHFLLPCGIYEREVDDTLDRVSGGKPVSPDPDVTDTCVVVHPAYHRHGARSGENGGACGSQNKMVDVAGLNGARFRVTKNRASSGRTGYFWRSIIEP